MEEKKRRRMRGVLLQARQRCLPLSVSKLPQRSEYLFDIRRELATVRVYEREERQFVPKMYKYMVSKKPSKSARRGTDVAIPIHDARRLEMRGGSTSRPYEGSLFG